MWGLDIAHLSGDSCEELTEADFVPFYKVYADITDGRIIQQ